MHLRHDILAIDQYPWIARGIARGIPRRAQGDMQRGAALGEVDLLAAKHRVAALGHAAFAGKRQQQAHGLGGDAVFRVIQMQPPALHREPFRPAGIIGEQLAQMRVLDPRMMRLQRPPCRRLGGSRGGRHACFLG